MVGVAQGGLLGNEPLLIQGQDGVVHRQHALGPAGDDGVFNLVVLLLPDHAPDGAVDVHQLKSGDDIAGFIRDHLLGHHGAQHISQLEPDLGLVGAGEAVDHAVDGIDSAFGMHGGDDGVAGLGGGDGGADGLGVPHFAQQDHIRRLPQAGPQGGEIILGIDGDLPLADDAALIFMEVFDGILQGDDVAIPGAVDLVDDAGLGSGLAAAGGASEQDHAVGDIGQVHDLLGDVDLLPLGNVKGDYPHHSCQGVPLPVGIDTEPGQAGDGEGKIVITGGKVTIHGPLGQGIDLPDQPLSLGGIESFILHRLEMSLDLLADRTAGHDKKIRCAVSHRVFKIAA